MIPHIHEEFFTRLTDWSSFVIIGNTMPPRDPDEDELEEEQEGKRVADAVQVLKFHGMSLSI